MLAHLLLPPLRHMLLLKALAATSSLPQRHNQWNSKRRHQRHSAGCRWLNGLHKRSQLYDRLLHSTTGDCFEWFIHPFGVFGNTHYAGKSLKRYTANSG